MSNKLKTIKTLVINTSRKALSLFLVFIPAFYLSLLYCVWPCSCSVAYSFGFCLRYCLPTIWPCVWLLWFWICPCCSHMLLLDLCLPHTLILPLTVVPINVLKKFYISTSTTLLTTAYCILIWFFIWFWVQS